MPWLVGYFFSSLVEYCDSCPPLFLPFILLKKVGNLKKDPPWSERLGDRNIANFTSRHPTINFSYNHCLAPSSPTSSYTHHEPSRYQLEPILGHPHPHGPRPQSGLACSGPCEGKCRDSACELHYLLFSRPAHSYNEALEVLVALSTLFHSWRSFVWAAESIEDGVDETGSKAIRR